jgi:hypothetical protein
MPTECLPLAKTLLRSRRLGSLSLRLGCGEPLHARVKGGAARRRVPVLPPAAAGREQPQT